MPCRRCDSEVVTRDGITRDGITRDKARGLRNQSGNRRLFLNIQLAKESDQLTRPAAKRSIGDRMSSPRQWTLHDPGGRLERYRRAA
jgi:hypothetical protein